MNQASNHSKPFNAGQAKRKIRACIFMVLAMSSLGAISSQPCAPAGGGFGFVAGEYSGGGIICGLPRSQNPVAGIGLEQDRKRAEQRAAWSRSLKEGQQAIPVKVDEPIPPHALTLPGIKE